MSFLPEPDREYLGGKGIGYVEIEHNGQKGVVLKDYALPPQRYNFTTVDVLVVLPSGYPDVPPDMFYTHPWVHLMPEDRPARAADRPFDFCGTHWQRWSRHCPDWRPGQDGIRTMVLRIQDALEVAKP